MTTFSKNFGTFPALLNEILNESNAGFNQYATPAANIIESADAFQISIAVPGYKKEQFKIEVLEKTLKVSVEKTETEEDENQKVVRREFFNSGFTRTFRISNLIDTDKIEASYADGVLSLVVPKKEEAKPKEPRVLEIA